MKMLRITLEGKTYEVGVEVLEDTSAPASHPAHISNISRNPVVHSPDTPHLQPVHNHVEGEGVVNSPMAAQVFKCLVKPGETVSINQVLLVLEAMKMETPVVSPYAGTVAAVMVSEGEAVNEGQALMQIAGA